jgi:hypothetical protein
VGGAWQRCFGGIRLKGRNPMMGKSGVTGVRQIQGNVEGRVVSGCIE